MEDMTPHPRIHGPHPVSRATATPANVWEAERLCHQVLVDLGIPHVLIGELAFAAHGFAIDAKSLVYLVHQEDAFDGTELLSFKTGVPIGVGNYGISYLATSDVSVQAQEECRAILKEGGLVRERLWLPPLELLIFLELEEGKARNLTLIQKFVSVGIDVAKAQRFLLQVGNERILALFERCLANAQPTPRNGG